MSKIVVSNISKSFGKTRAVKDISFDVRAGEIFGLLGGQTGLAKRPLSASFWTYISLIVAKWLFWAAR